VNITIESDTFNCRYYNARYHTLIVTEFNTDESLHNWTPFMALQGLMLNIFLLPGEHVEVIVGKGAPTL